MTPPTAPGVLAIVGAGPGLGASLARRFAQGGWSVGVVSRHDEVANACVADLTPFGTPAFGTAGDVVDPASVDESLGAICDELGTPTVIIYNASIYQAEPALELTPDKLKLALDVHVLGALNTAQTAVRLLRDAGRGVIVFTVNKLAREPEAGATALSIGKSAQLNLALSLDQELAGSGVHIAVVTICGAIATRTAFDPDRIAELYWTIANQDPDRFQRDHTFDGT